MTRNKSSKIKNPREESPGNTKDLCHYNPFKILSTQESFEPQKKQERSIALRSSHDYMQFPSNIYSDSSRISSQQRKIKMIKSDVDSTSHSSISIHPQNSMFKLQSREACFEKTQSRTPTIPIRDYHQEKTTPALSVNIARNNPKQKHSTNSDFRLPMRHHYFATIPSSPLSLYHRRLHTSFSQQRKRYNLKISEGKATTNPFISIYSQNSMCSKQFREFDSYKQQSRASKIPSIRDENEQTTLELSLAIERTKPENHHSTNFDHCPSTHHCSCEVFYSSSSPLNNRRQNRYRRLIYQDSSWLKLHQQILATNNHRRRELQSETIFVQLHHP